MIIRLTAVMAVLAASTTAAQDPGSSGDGGWRAYAAQHDSSSAGADTSSIVRMPPGWHITTGPRTFYSNPTTGAGGRFRVESETFFFPGPSSSFLGLIIGGQALETPRPTGLVFLLRRDGMAAVHTLEAGRHAVLLDWMPADSAVVQQGDEIVKNVLQVSVEQDSLRFAVNGARTFAMANRRVSTSGLTAFLASEQLNAHITTLDITYPHAPSRGSE